MFINNFVYVYISEINHTQHKEGVVEYFLRFDFHLLLLRYLDCFGLF